MNDAPKTIPDIVKVAAVLLIAHGVLIVLHAARAAQLAGVWSGLPLALIWLGVTIVLSGALFERQVWAWRLVTIAGGCVGVFKVLQVMGYYLFQSSGFEQDKTFSPALTGAAGIAMLLSTMLLMMPEAKEAFGQRKPAKPRALGDASGDALGDASGDYEKSNDDIDQKRARD